MPGGRGECGARGRGLISSASGWPGHHACRHYDRRVRCSLDWDRRRRVTPASGFCLRMISSENRFPLFRIMRQTEPRKHGLGCALGDVSPLGKSRGGTPAGERARERKGRRKPLLPWRDPRAVFACGRCYPRLSAFRFPYFLLRSPDERSDIRGGHEAARSFPDIAPLIRATARSTGRLTSLFDNSRAHFALRERDRVASAPAQRGRADQRSVVEGASDSTLRCRRRNIVSSRAPLTILRATRYGWSPSPLSRGGKTTPSRICRD